MSERVGYLLIILGLPFKVLGPTFYVTKDMYFTSQWLSYCRLQAKKTAAVVIFGWLFDHFATTDKLHPHNAESWNLTQR